MNTDKAYLVGLLFGGAEINRDYTKLIINLPYRSWGKINLNTARAGQIGRDILTKIKPVFENEYAILISFEPEPEWRITCSGDLKLLKKDLSSLGIETSGELRKVASLSKVIPKLSTIELKRSFISGLVDSIGSLSPSHRRFSTDFQIISFEFSGNNFENIVFICNLLRDINCHSDQILWNHPNFHSTDNPYYTNWKKGFKLRVLLDQYIGEGSFVSSAKQKSALQNIQKQSKGSHVAFLCEQRPINVGKKTVHIAEISSQLPMKIRGYHFLHYKHICAVLGCPYAPINKLEPYIREAHKYINPFPIVARGSVSEIYELVEKSPIMKNRVYEEIYFSIHEIFKISKENEKSLCFGSDSQTGYPVTEILQAFAYLVAGVLGKLFGTRVKGNYLSYLDLTVSENVKIINTIKILKPNKLTPLIIKNEKFGVLIGPENPSVYKKLITYEDGLRLKIRSITEEDLDGE